MEKKITPPDSVHKKKPAIAARTEGQSRDTAANVHGVLNDVRQLDAPQITDELRLALKNAGIDLPPGAGLHLKVIHPIAPAPTASAKTETPSNTLSKEAPVSTDERLGQTLYDEICALLEDRANASMQNDLGYLKFALAKYLQNPNDKDAALDVYVYAYDVYFAAAQLLSLGVEDEFQPPNLNNICSVTAKLNMEIIEPTLKKLGLAPRPLTTDAVMKGDDGGGQNTYLRGANQHTRNLAVVVRPPWYDQTNEKPIIPAMVRYMLNDPLWKEWAKSNFDYPESPLSKIM